MIAIRSVDHIGIRITDRARAVEFYEKLGFVTVSEHAKDHVLVVRNAAGVEINFIINGKPYGAGENPLMDIADKYPGYTHVAFSVESIPHTVEALAVLGVPITGGPDRLGDGVSLFLRDPDRNVIELRQRIA
jgi:lactoylglutathione lyase